jgi:hypothetical protein
MLKWQHVVREQDVYGSKNSYKVMTLLRIMPGVDRGSIAYTETTRSFSRRFRPSPGRPIPVSFVRCASHLRLELRDALRKISEFFISYRNGFPQDLLPDFWFERIFHHQIYFYSQEIRKIILNRNIGQQAWIFLERDQNIQIAVLFLL